MPTGVGARTVEVTEEHEVFCATNTLFQAGHRARRALSIGPGSLLDNDDPEDESVSNREAALSVPRQSSARRPASTNASRRVSAESLTEGQSYEENHPLPPYTPSASPPMLLPSSSYLSPGPESPAQTLEDSRNALRADLSEITSEPACFNLQVIPMI